MTREARLRKAILAAASELYPYAPRLYLETIAEMHEKKAYGEDGPTFFLKPVLTHWRSYEEQTP